MPEIGQLRRTAILVTALTLSTLCVAEDEATPALDAVTVKGVTLQGHIIEQTGEGIRFQTIYGEGELLIPYLDVERYEINGEPRTLTPPTPQSDSSLTNTAVVPETVVVVVTNTVSQVPPEEVATKAEPLSTASPESVESQLDQEQAIKETFFEQARYWLGFPYYYKTQSWLDRKLGLRVGVAYAALGMVATDSVMGDQGAASGDFDFFGRWGIWGKETGNTGTVGFNMRYRHKYSDIPPSELGSNIGSLWNVTGGFTDAGFQFTQLYLDQYFLEKNVGVRFGQIFQDFHFDTYSYKSAKLYFLNAAFSDNPAVAFPDYSVGFATLIRPVKDWYFISGVGNASGRKLEAGLPDFLANDKLFSGLELGWKPTTGPLANHRFSAFAWTTPADSNSATPDGNGITVTYEWQPPTDYGIFARYSWSGSEATRVEHLATTGVVKKKPFDRELDLFGIAAAWGTPSEPGRRGQGVFEMFYRFQITSLFQLTPDVQFIITPSLNPDSDLVAIFGLRGRLAL